MWASHIRAVLAPHGGAVTFASFVDDDRSVERRRDRQLVRKRRALSLTRRVVVVVVQSTFADRDRPVAATGMVLGDRLLTEPGSTLYSPVGDDVLAQALSEALAALDPSPSAVAALSVRG